jgi:hypothetical protein
MGCVNSNIAVSTPKFDVLKLQNAQNRFQNPQKLASKSAKNIV